MGEHAGDGLANVFANILGSAQSVDRGGRVANEAPEGVTSFPGIFFLLLSCE